MKKRYTVTVYVAAPGTPLTKEDGSPLLLPGSNKQDHSVVGHLYYKVSDGTVAGTKGFGFAPKKEGEAFGLGEVKKDEFKKYQNPIYERTLEISEQQYKKLLNYGQNPMLGKFDATDYNGVNNSCVDFLYGGLAYAEIYNPKRSIWNPRSWIGNKNYEGEVKVRPNMDELDKIPNQKGFESSELNTPLNKRRNNPEPSCEKAFGKLPTTKELLNDKKAWEGIKEKVGCRVAENEQDLRYQYAQLESVSPSLQIEDMPQFAQNIYHQGRQIFTEFCQMKNIPYDEKNLDNIAMSMAAAGYANHMRGVSMINIKDDGQILIGHKALELRKAAVDMAEAISTPIEESLAKVQETARQFEYEAQQRQLAQSQSRGMSLS